MFSFFDIGIGLLLLPILDVAMSKELLNKIDSSALNPIQ
jgi:hypothetical protein